MRVTHIEVEGLFGRFSHSIPLSTDSRVTVLTGLNGSGKTTVLKMIDILFNRPFTRFRPIPFRRFALSLDDGSKLEFAKVAGPDGAASSQIVLSRRGNESERFSPPERLGREDLSLPVSAIEEVIEGLNRVGPEAWQNSLTGAVLSLEEVMEQYPEVLGQTGQSVIPEWLSSIRSQISVSLIETDRLFAQQGQPRSAPYPVRPSFARRRVPRQFFTVQRFSQELAASINDAQAEYGRVGQSLDRSLPRRFVEKHEKQPIAEGALRKRLEETEQKAKRLTNAGLLPPETSPTDLPKYQTIDQEKIAMLWLLAEDVEEKLRSFDSLFAKVDRFKSTLESRFKRKRVTVGREFGIRVDDEEGGTVPLPALSSGEQHELVLLYELLFNVKPNTLFLIDEPEISLHVAWQVEFLEDLVRLASLSSFDAIVATHSPYIIGERSDLVVSLGAPGAPASKE